ncbi:MAG: hypothetical protein JRG79_01670 [Deltaproteobacteria bacterium]|nr:hypothetical protein [Deltaproteobacteria bacterium]
MSFKIIIERKFKEPVSQNVLEIIDEIRIKALRDRGYIGGETLVNADNGKEVIVVSSWSSVDDWKTWYEKKDWEDLEKQLGSQLEEPAKVRIFTPGADYSKASR